MRARWASRNQAETKPASLRLSHAPRRRSIHVREARGRGRVPYRRLQRHALKRAFCPASHGIESCNTGNLAF
jgi:hypothetical protein